MLVTISNKIHIVERKEKIHISGRCHQEELENDECFGGMARMFTAIQHFKDKAPNTLLLNAGDYFQVEI